VLTVAKIVGFWIPKY